MLRLGLVLGGGGIVGMAYHGAVLAAIADVTGWDPRDAGIVVGTSAGAASGAELRAGVPATDMAARRSGDQFSIEGERLLVSLGPPPQVRPTYVRRDAARVRAGLRRAMIRTTMLPWTARPGVLAALAMAPGRLSTAWLERQTEWLLGGKRWPERDLWLCAVDVETGRRVVFGSDGGPRATPGEAVAASCAIPGVFAPVSIGRRLYLDGGAWSPTNADVLAGRRLDLVIVVSPMSLAHGRESRSGDDWIRAACGAALAAEVAVLRCHGTRVAVIEPAPDDARVMGRIIGLDVLDEGRCRDVVGQVRRSTAARIRAGSIPGLELLRSGDAAYNPGSTVGLGLAA